MTAMLRCAASISWKWCVTEGLLEALRQPLSSDQVALALYQDHHHAPLRAACAEDTAIWQIYPYDFGGDFDASMAIFAANPDWVRYVILDPAQANRVIGMTNYIRADVTGKSLEIGGTYITPSMRGTGLNRAMKDLMINHAFACGFVRIEWRVDTRNKRSQAAVLKLGATFGHTIEQDRKTWTGYVRDTAVFYMEREAPRA